MQVAPCLPLSLIAPEPAAQAAGTPFCQHLWAMGSSEAQQEQVLLAGVKLAFNETPNALPWGCAAPSYMAASLLLLGEAGH